MKKLVRKRRWTTIGVSNYVSQVTRVSHFILRSTVCHVIRIEMCSYNLQVKKQINKQNQCENNMKESRL